MELIEKGENKNCRAYSVKDKQYVHGLTLIYRQSYVHPAYSRQALWERYVLVTWKIIRYSRVRLVQFVSNPTLQRATSLSRDGSLLLAAGLHLVSQTPSIEVFSDH